MTLQLTSHLDDVQESMDGMIGEATAIFAALKRLLKVALILAIAGALYLLLVEYFGAGL